MGKWDTVILFQRDWDLIIKLNEDANSTVNIRSTFHRSFSSAQQSDALPWGSVVADYRNSDQCV